MSYICNVIKKQTIMNEYLVLSLDSTDDLEEGAMIVSEPMNEADARKEYGKAKKVISNVYLVKILDSAENI
jgi:hypothetical protein